MNTTNNQFPQPPFVTYPDLTFCVHRIALARQEVKEKGSGNVDPITAIARIASGIPNLRLTVQQREQIKVINLCNAYSFSPEYSKHLMQTARVNTRNKARNERTLGYYKGRDENE